MNNEPQQLTHTVRTDIVNRDASVKRIEIDFCATDHWSDCWPGMMNIAEMLQSGINGMIKQDENAVGSQQTILDAKMCEPLKTSKFLPCITKPEFFQSSQNSK